MKKKDIQNTLPNGWVVTKYIKINGDRVKETLEVEKENEIISFEVLGRKTSPKRTMLNVTSIQGENKKEYRNVVFLIHSTCFSETLLTSNSIRQLLSKEELVHLFGECEEHVHTSIENLNFSVRGYGCLLHEEYKTVFDIAWNTPEEIGSIPQLVGPAYDEIIDTMNRLQIPWDMKSKIKPLLQQNI